MDPRGSLYFAFERHNRSCFMLGLAETENIGKGVSTLSDGFLHKYFLSNPSKRLHKWLHYFDIYERHFERFRGKSPIMLEIGVSHGGSLEMWKEYFGPGTKIVGMDIEPECKQHEGVDIDIHIGSQSDSVLLGLIKQKYPRIDIVLDDASHLSTHMIATFGALYSHVHPRGVYMVEDTHTNYWPDWGGHPGAPGSFMEFVKERMDDLNAFHARGAIPVTQFTSTTSSISVYDSVVVFEKAPQSWRTSVQTSGMFMSA
jgi:hypothetical protein